MQILITLAVASMATTATPAVRSDPVLVRAVIDGDTIDVATLGRVRLLGIDAPETGRGFDTSAPFGQEARDRLSALVLHRWVRLEYDGVPLDAYDRRLAYVLREDGLFVNAALVRDGLARVTARVPLTRLQELKAAEAEAQAFRRGMWGATPQIPPTRYTHRPSDTTRPKRPSTGADRASTSKKKSRGAKKRRPRRGASWQPFPSSTHPSARFAIGTSCTTDSTTGRSGSSCSSSRPVRSRSISSSAGSMRGWRSG